MIDCVEGVSPQTTTVIRQAWEAKVKTCLVLNKIDRLIIDKWYDAKECYNWIMQIIENANSYVSELIQGDFLKRQQEMDKRDRRLSSNNSSGSEKMTDAELEAALDRVDHDHDRVVARAAGVDHRVGGQQVEQQVTAGHQRQGDE